MFVLLDEMANDHNCQSGLHKHNATR